MLSETAVTEWQIQYKTCRAQQLLLHHLLFSRSLKLPTGIKERRRGAGWWRGPCPLCGMVWPITAPPGGSPASHSPEQPLYQLQWEEQLWVSSAAMPVSSHCFLPPLWTGCPSETDCGFTSVSPWVNQGSVQTPRMLTWCWLLSAQQMPSLESERQGNSRTYESICSLENCVMRAWAHTRHQEPQLPVTEGLPHRAGRGAQGTEATVARGATSTPRLQTYVFCFFLELFKEQIFKPPMMAFFKKQNILYFNYN